MLKSGDRVGKWTVIEPAAPTKWKQARWLCRCECGTQRPVAAHHLKLARSMSCGCGPHMNGLTHGGTLGGVSSPEHYSWRGMRTRCQNPRASNWRLYGGRGIQVCERWDSFAAFLEDMGPKPTPQHSIERLDRNGDYKPGNCIWATAKQQARNTSRNRRITFRGETRTVPEWAERTGLPYSILKKRFGLGWSVEKALTRPIGRWAEASLS